MDNVIQVFQYKKQLEITVKGQTEKLKKQNAVTIIHAHTFFSNLHSDHYNIFVFEFKNNPAHIGTQHIFYHSSHIRTFLEVGRNVLYDKQQAEFEKRREQILEQLSMLEERWNKILKSLPPDKEKAVELIKKLNGAIVAKDHELADLDADISKLAHITDEGMKAVLVSSSFSRIKIVSRTIIHAHTFFSNLHSDHYNIFVFEFRWNMRKKAMSTVL